MSKPLPMSRNLLLSDDIEARTVKPIIQMIFEINQNDDDRENEYKDWVREPILLFINSFGGSVYDGLALVDVIKKSKTPVYTICIGSCMSMGLWIFMAGHKRLAGRTSTFMFHDVSKSIRGKSENIKQELTEMRRLGSILIDELVEKTSIKKEQLEGYINRQAEWYIPADKAVQLKIADEYY